MATRRNLCPNPACKYTSAGDAGWYGGSRQTGLSGFPRSTGYRINSGSQGGAARGNIDQYYTYTASAYVRTTFSGTLYAQVNWYRNGSYLSGGNQVGFSVSYGSVRRISITAQAPYGADQLLLNFPSRGGTVTLTAVLIESGSTLGDYFDGDSPGASWDGSNGSSTSRITATQTQTVTVHDGIDPSSSVGTPALLGTAILTAAAIAPTIVFGAAVVDYAKLRPAAIEPTAAVGVPALVPGEATVSPAGFDSTPGFGRPALRTSLNLSGQAGAVRRAITYDLVMVARVPSASGPPALIEVDSIVWKGLSWAEELSKPQRLDVSAALSTLSDETVQRLTRSRELPSELRLYRGGRLVFAGPLMNGQRQGETVTMYALGLLGYARYWWVESDLIFPQADQFAIATGLIDHWQALEFGNYGIDTSGVGASGIVRDATYLAKENHNIGTRLEELGKRVNGFDIDVDPITRALQLYYPVKGIDRSDGPDAIVFDGSNITNADVAWSVAPDDVASEAYGTGTGGDSSIRSQASNPDVRAQFGRCGVAASFDGVSEQATLDEHTQALVDARQDALIVPGPDVRVTPDVDPTSYTVGDTVSYVLPDRLGVIGSFRLRKRTIKVADSGREVASFEFA